MAVYGEKQFKATLGDLIPVDANRVSTPADGDVISLGARELTVMATPGHALNHICIWDEKSRGLFTGDAFGISYRELDGGRAPFIFPATTPTQLDPDAYHASLNRLAALAPETIYLTHFDAVPYSRELLDSLHTQLEQYVDLAKKARQGGDDDKERLLSALESNMHDNVKKLGFQGDVGSLDHILAPDREINAQGLLAWLKRLEKNRG